MQGGIVLIELRISHKEPSFEQWSSQACELHHEETMGQRENYTDCRLSIPDGPTWITDVQ